MTDPDEVLLPTGDGGGGSLHPSDLDALSSEARLATALVMQAQALEGMRSAQGDLLRRLDGRRRIQRGVVLAFGAVLLAVGGLGLWIEHRLAQQGEAQLDGTQLAALLEAQAREQAGARLASEAVWSQGLVDLEEEHRVALAALGDLLDTRLTEERARGSAALRDELAAFTELSAERDGLLLRASSLEADNARMSAQLEATAGEGGALRAEFEELEIRHQRMIGENTHLRTRLLTQDAELANLRETLLQVEAAVEERLSRPKAIVVAEPGGSGLADAANAALRAGGATDARIAEVGGLDAGGLLDLLVVRTDEFGLPIEVVRGRRADLTTVGGRTVLRVQRIPAEVAAEAQATQPPTTPALGALGALEAALGIVAPIDVFDILLPAFDPAPWRALGLSVPEVTPLSDLLIAFQEVIEPWGLRVVSAEGLIDDALLDVVVKEENDRGELQRTYRAARARLLAEGPELVLEVGTVTVNGEQRPFFRDTLHLALPGADLRPWRSALLP